MVIERLVLGVMLAGVLLAAGCGTSPDPGAQRSPSSAAPLTSSGAEPSADPSESRRPVAAAGGVCKLLSYQLVARSIGVEFDTAAGGRNACALQVYGHPYPSLTLAVSTTKADVKTFQEAVPPDGATRVSGLGKAAYRVAAKPSRRAGPSAEAGWLLDSKIYILRYTFERGVAQGQAGRMASRLVTLGKQIKPPK